ncbi:MAG: glycosyltransferase [Candidatus Aenigmatarchaeota archaeon]
MKNGKIIVATITWDGGISAEGGKIIKTMRELKKYGYDVITVDGGSSKETIEGMRESGAKIYRQKGKGIGSAMKESIRHAYDSGADAIVYMESDKYSYPKEIEKTIGPVLGGKADLVVPSRSAKSFLTYPPFQILTESLINASISVILKNFADYTYGSRTFGRKVAPYFFESRYSDWGVMYNPLKRLKQDGFKTKAVYVDVSFPKEDYRKEFASAKVWRYRLKQIKQDLKPVLK